MKRFGDRIRQIGWGRVGLEQGGEMRWLDLHSLVDGNVAALNAQLDAEEELARWLELTEAASN